MRNLRQTYSCRSTWSECKCRMRSCVRSISVFRTEPAWAAMVDTSTCGDRDGQPWSPAPPKHTAGDAVQGRNWASSYERHEFDGHNRNPISPALLKIEGPFAWCWHRRHPQLQKLPQGGKEPLPTSCLIPTSYLQVWVSLLICSQETVFSRTRSWMAEWDRMGWNGMGYDGMGYDRI